MRKDTWSRSEVPNVYLPIFERYLPEWAELFLEKSTDYGEAGYNGLGAKGQFVDINRKVTKLRRAIWEGHELIGEQVPEILNDLISHCLLMRLIWDEEHEKKDAALETRFIDLERDEER